MKAARQDDRPAFHGCQGRPGVGAGAGVVSAGVLPGVQSTAASNSRWPASWTGLNRSGILVDNRWSEPNDSDL